MTEPLYISYPIIRYKVDITVIVYQCSMCEFSSILEGYNFCPICGAPINWELSERYEGLN